MNRAVRNRVRPAVVAAAFAALLGWSCSGLDGSATVGVGRAAERSQDILVTLRPGYERLWPHIGKELAVLEAVHVRASWFMRSLGEQCLVLELAPGRDPEPVAKRLANHARISSVTVSRRFRLLGDGDDPYASLQEAVAPLRLELAHRVATGRGVSVAIVDTGLEIDHPDLVGRVRRAHDFVGRDHGAFTSEMHGTAVAGVVAARAGNGVGGFGVAPDAELWALRACWQEPVGSPAAVCNSYTLAQALDLAVAEGARVINLSLAGERDPLLERLVRLALARGAVVVAAAEGEPATFPASIPGVVAVHAWAGNRPQPLDAPRLTSEALVAPGLDILTTVPQGGFDFVSGSSFAAAQASGVVALLLERLPKLGPDEIGRILLASASSAGGADGPRLLDACAALEAAVGGDLCSD